jgi:REP element-mobilizing transposase RayT
MPTLGLTKELYFITTTVIDWMDVFTRPIYKRIVIDSLRYCQEHKGLQIYAWVLMTNHIHLIADAGLQNQPNRILIGDIMRDFKKFTSKSIVKAIQDHPQESRKEWLLDRCWFRGYNDRKISQFKLWQDDYYSEVITSYDFYKQKLDYIHNNPVRQEIVQRPEEYLYSSARDYCGSNGLLEVIVLT